LVSLFSRKSLKSLPPDLIFQGENASNLISAGALPQTPLGSSQHSPRSPSWILGGLLLRERGRKGEDTGKERRVKEEGKEREEKGARGGEGKETRPSN